LINFTDSDLASDAQDDGDDILFVAEDGETKLAHEIEYFNGDNGALVAWVNVTVLSSWKDTVIYMYYGNSESGNQSNPEGVWDCNYVAVYHLSESGDGTANEFKDSTNNGYHGQGGAGTSTDVPNRVWGKLGYGQDFDGMDDYIQVDSMNPRDWGDFTATAWYKSDNDTAVDDGYIFDHSEGYGTGPGFALTVSDDTGYEDGPRFLLYDNTPSSNSLTTGTDVVDQTYHYLGIARNLYRKAIFVDGSYNGGEVDSFSGQIINVAAAAQIGDKPGDTEQVDGVVDEIRVSNTARSDAWIATEYYNMNDPSSFHSVGSEVATSTLSSSGYEWVELYNAGSSSVDLTGWNLTDHHGNRFNLSGAGSIASEGYLMCHIDQSGTNSSTNVYGYLEKEFTIQPDASAGKDNYMLSNAATLNFGTATIVSIKNDATSEHRPLLQFDVSSVPENIKNAKLWLYRSSGNSYTSDIAVHRVTQSWTEAGSNWNTYDGSNSWGTSGGDYDSNVFDKKTVAAANGWYSWDITSLVEGWTSGIYTNNGLLLKHDYNADAANPYFRSSDYATASERPKLVINLTDNMLAFTDGLTLETGSGGIIDYIAWGANATGDDDDAVSNTQWTDSEFIDTSPIAENQSIGRTNQSADTDLPADWVGPATDRADPFGIHSGSWTQGALNKDQYSLVINEFLTNPSGGPYETGWSYSTKITISPANVDDDLTDFPDMVNINSTDLRDNARSDGYDILFTDGERDTKLDHEIERYDSSTGNLTAWVKIPFLSESNETVIYMYYGNSSADDQQNVYGVWENGFVGVYHMSEGSGPLANSASPRYYAGRAFSPTRANSVVGYGQEFKGAGSDDAFYVGDLGIADGVNTNITVSAWFKPDYTIMTAWEKFFCKRTSDSTDYVYFISLTDDYRIYAHTNGDSGAYINVHNNQTFYATLTYDGAIRRLYVNDKLENDETRNEILWASVAPTVIGSREANSQNFGGIMDEVRFSNVARSPAWIKAEYFNMNASESFITIGDWSNRKTITIDADNVAGNLTNFPVFIDITDSDLASDAQSSGNDIYFTSSDGTTKLNHEFTYYDSSTGRLKAWVSVPFLSSSTDTTLYMYYNNPNAGNQSNPSATWDENYRGVWHLQESPVADSDDLHRDSSGNGNHLEPQNAMDSNDQVPGTIDGSLVFDGVDDYISRAEWEATNLEFGTSDLTIESWVKLESTSADSYPAIIEKGATGGTTAGYMFYYHNANDYLGFNICDGTTRATVTSYVGIKDDTWHHVVAVADRDGKGMIYIDGRLDNGDDWTAWDGNSITNTVRRFQISDSSTDGNWDGGIDEVRISDAARSWEWINTSYQNQNNPSSFVTVGSEESVSAGAAESVGTYYQWVEIYNPTSATTNLNDLYLFDNDGNKFDLSGAGTISSDSYVVAHIGQAGTNSSTDVYGPVNYDYSQGSRGMFAAEDDMVLASSQGYILDYVAWGGGSEYDMNLAASYNHWPSNNTVNITGITFNETLGRTKNSTDTNSTADWENPSNNYADPYGIHAWSQTQSSINLDSQVVINEIQFNPSDSEYFGWANKKKITIDSSNVPGDLTNFPVMISITDPDLAARAQSDGDDIMFLASDESTKYRHEIERYDSSTGTLVAWVNVTLLQGGSDTVLYMYYNNPAAEDQSNASGVWDQNFLAVHHLEEDPTGTIDDSTSNDNDLTQNNMDTADLVDGQIGKGFNFDSSGTEYLNSGAGTITIEKFTFSLWNNPEVHSSVWEVLMNFDTGYVDASYFAISSNDRLSHDGGAGLYYFGSGGDVAENDWQHMVVLYDGTNLEAYLDGTQLGTSQSASISSRTDDWEVASYAGGAEYHDGIMDEVRISNTNRSSNWIATEYANQNTPSTFYTVSDEMINDKGFLYRKNITIASSLVDGALTNFPILVSMTDTDLKNNSQPDGDDIVFTRSADGMTKYNHELERYFKATGELVAWVNITSLSATSDTYMYMYYGDPDGYSQEKPEDVWDVDYVGVWHLNETNETSYDATGNGNDGTPQGDISQISEGKIAYGDEFNGPNDNELTISDSAAMEPSSLTLELWWNTEWLPSVNGDFVAAFSNAEDDWSAGYVMCLYRNDGSSFDGLQFFADQAVWDPVEYPTSKINTNVWYWAAATYDGGTDGSELFINGSSYDTAATTGPIADTTVDINIGNQDWDEWMGKLDEIRLSKVVRSDAWLSTSFNTQNNTDTFISVGAQESTSASPSYEWVEIYNKGDTSVDLTGWYITDNDDNVFYLTGASSIAADSYVVAHLAQLGTNSTTDVYGEIYGPSATNSITIQPGRSNGKDVHFYQGTPEERNGEDSYFEIADYNDAGEERILFEFNMSYIPGTNITDANIWLYRYDGSSSSPGHLNVRRITRNWTEAYADWNDYDSGNAWSNGGGGDFTDKVYSWKTVNPSVNKWYYWNVTELVQGWISGTWENYGLEIEAHWSSSWQQFRSSDYIADLTLRPKLIVNYSVPVTILSMLGNNDDLSLCDSNGDVVDYVAWGPYQESQDSAAALARGLWQPGIYVDVSNLAENETLGRDRFSTDYDNSGDWENSTTNTASPYGINATEQTPNAVNWFIIPEFTDYVFGGVLIAVIIMFSSFRKKKK
jgi:hypothetical protein